MKYCIMCGGYYDKFKTPKHLLEIGGERIVERTIRWLVTMRLEDWIEFYKKEAEND